MAWSGRSDIPEQRLTQEDMLREEAERVHAAKKAESVARESGHVPWWRRLFGGGKKGEASG
jgi:hypothetical protein